jgi:hypothetical protein
MTKTANTVIRAITKKANIYTVTLNKKRYKGIVFNNGIITRQFRNFCKRNKLHIESTVTELLYFEIYDNCSYHKL